MPPKKEDKTPAKSAVTAEAPANETVAGQAQPSALQQVIDKKYGTKLGQVYGTAGEQELFDRLKKVIEDLASEGAELQDFKSQLRAKIRELDNKLCAQVNGIIHHEKFRELEGTWRGLERLVLKTPTGQKVKIAVFNATKEEVYDDLSQHQDLKIFDDPLYEKLCESEFEQYGGVPYGLILSDYSFGKSSMDVTVLKGMARIAAAGHAIFLGGAAPNLLKGVQDWSQLQNIREPAKLFEGPEYAKWHSFRESEESRYVGLTMPPILGREPYGAEKRRLSSWPTFEEETAGQSANYVWTSSVYPMAENIMWAFMKYGWCSQIVGPKAGGAVKELVYDTFPTTDGRVDMKSPVAVGISDPKEFKLTEQGLIPLVHKKGSDEAAFFGAPSVHKINREYHDADARANEELSSDLTYILVACRFAHYLKAICKEMIGRPMERANLEDWLKKWIGNYVTINKNPSEKEKMERPLSDARIEVFEIPGKPGYYDAKIRLRPHYKLKAMTGYISLEGRFKKSETT